jgi:hypothetical protein
MEHVFVTLNDTASLTAMDNYKGTHLIYNDGDFAFWHCTDLAQANIDEIHREGVPHLVGMLLLNKPALPTVQTIVESMNVIPL